MSLRMNSHTLMISSRGLGGIPEHISQLRTSVLGVGGKAWDQECEWESGLGPAGRDAWSLQRQEGPCLFPIGGVVLLVTSLI